MLLISEMALPSRRADASERFGVIMVASGKRLREEDTGDGAADQTCSGNCMVQVSVHIYTPWCNEVSCRSGIMAYAGKDISLRASQCMHDDAKVTDMRLKGRAYFSLRAEATSESPRL